MITNTVLAALLIASVMLASWISLIYLTGWAFAHGWRDAMGDKKDD